jgi:hypothetical protein
MTIQLKYLAAIVIVAMAAGAALTRQFAPREVIKTQLVDHDVIKDHVVTVTKEIVNKDGSKEIDTTVVDDKKENDVKKETVVDSKPIPQLKPQWFVTAGAGLDVTSLGNMANPVYSGSVNRRILGPIYLGVWGNTRSQVGVQLGLEF